MLHDADPAVLERRDASAVAATYAGHDVRAGGRCRAAAIDDVSAAADRDDRPASATSYLLCAIDKVRQWRLLGRLLLAGVVVMLALFVRMALVDALSGANLYATFFPAVVIAALLGRFASGAFAVFLSLLAAQFLRQEATDASGWIGPLVFVVEGVIVSGLAEALHVTLDRAAGRETQAARAPAALHLAALVDSTDDAVIGFDLEGHITSWNRAAERLFGYSTHEAIGRDADLLVAPLGRILPGETARGAFDHALSGRRFQRDTMRVAKDGTVIEVSVTANLIRAPDGRAIGVSAIMRDIRDRRSADAALRASEGRLRRFIADAPAAIAMLDREMRYVAASQRWATEYGLELDNLIGRSHYDAHPELPEHYGAVHRRALAGEVVRADEDPFPKADGTPRWVRWEVRPWHEADSSIGGIIIMSEDVTPKVQAMRELRESREDLNRAQSIAHIGSWRLDVVRNELTWSEENYRIFGVPQGTHLTYQTFLSAVHPDDRDDVDRCWSAALGGAPYDIEHRIVVAGATRWVRERAGLEFDRDGKLLGGFGTTEDITEKRNAEAALRESEQQLRFAMAGAHAAAWQWNVVTGEQVWSPEGYALHGRDPALGPPSYEDWLACLHPDDRLPLDVVMREAVEQRTRDFRTEYRVVLASGEVRWLAALGNVEFLDNGQPARMFGINLDITERKRAAEQMAAAKQRLDAHIDNSPLAVIEFDPEFRIVRWSLEAERMFGWSSPEVIGRAIGELRWVHEDDAEVVQAVTLAMVDGRKPRNVTTNRNYNKDGATLYCEWYNSAIYDAQGRLTSIFSQVLDITVRKKAEEALRNSEARLAALIHSAMDGIISVDAAQRIRLFNPAAERLFGYTAQQMLGEPLTRLLPPRYRDSHTDHLRSFAMTGATALRMGTLGEVAGLKSSGEEFPMEGSISRTELAGELVLTAMVRDVTERKRAEAAIRESEERLRLSTEAGGIGTFTIELPSNEMRYSPEAAAMFGGGDELTGNLAEALARVHRDDIAEVQRQLDAVLEANGPDKLGLEFRLVRGGEVRWMMWNGRVDFADTAGRRTPQRILGVCVDTTERRQALEELARAKSELERRVAERTAALQDEMRQRQAAQAALAHSQRLEALGRLAGGLTHDFNNTLAAVSAQLEMAELRVQDVIARDCLHKALDAVELGASLNRRLLTFARRGSGTRQIIDTADRIATLIGLLRRTLGGAVTVDTWIANGVWRTRLDPGELESAVINLVINARDAMPDGGTLTIAVENVTLEANRIGADATRRSGEFVKLTVSDNGTGMTAEVLQRAGEPFVTTKGAAKGTGLGLSSVREFVRGADGFMTIDSVLGVGTAVSLYLKRESGTGEEPRREVAKDVPLGDGELVLLVEDDERVLEATHAMLEGLGYSVVDARNGAEAMSLLADNAQVQLVLSDIVMPGGMSGFDVARRVLAEYPGIAIVMASGFNDEERGQDAVLRELPVLRKPYTRAALAEILHAALHARGGNEAAAPR